MDGRDLFFPYTNFPGFYSHPLPANDFYPHQQDVRGMPPFRQFIGPEPATSENQSAIQSSACESPCTSKASGSPHSASTGGNSGKQSYEKWSEEEKLLLKLLWAENFDYLESKDDRKRCGNGSQTAISCSQRSSKQSVATIYPSFHQQNKSKQLILLLLNS